MSDAGDLTVRELVEHSGLGLTAATGKVGLGGPSRASTSPTPTIRCST